MGLRFAEPLYLLLLLPAAAAAILLNRSTKRLGGTRKTIFAVIRAAIVLLLVMAIAGLQGMTVHHRLSVVYVVDGSDSMQGDAAVAQWVRASAAAKAEDDRAAVVRAGLDAAVERSPGTAGLEQLTFAATLNERYTNLAQALQLASSLQALDAATRIVLVSDGNENVGDMLREARLLQHAGIPVDVLPVPAPPRKDAAVERLSLPAKLYQGEQFALEVQVQATFAGSGELRLYEDNRELDRRRIDVTRGDNRFALQSLARDPGLHRYRAEIYFDGDAQSANDTGYAVSRVDGPPKVLLVESAPGASANIAAALQSSLIEANRIAPEMLPREWADYAAYDSVILDNVPAYRMSQQQMELLERAVRDLGVGLLMAGGQDGYGLGGYFGTPIERALPVKMELEGKREIPSLALILVIDRSGSMGGDKIELAKEAAMRTVELLREKDTVGVVAFDDSPWWVVEPQKLTDKQVVLNRIGSIQPAGGTEIYTAVADAYGKLLPVQAQRKHIVLLTDGQSATNQSYAQLTAQMQEAGMTMSTVAVGDDADKRLLESLATLAKGRYYYTNDQSTLPSILSRETVMMSRTYIVDSPFVPAAGQLGDWSGLFAQGVPSIDAYVATTAKPTAEVGLLSPEPDPLLARWQYGAGRSVAWTSDFSGKWSSAWINWTRFPEAFSRFVKWTFPQFDPAAYQIGVTTTGNDATLAITGGSAAQMSELDVKVVDEKLQSSELQALPTAPGEYEATMAIDNPGVYLVQISGKGDGAETKTQTATTGFVVPYSPEYRLSSDDGTAKLKQLAAETGGRVLSLEAPEEVYRPDRPAQRQSHDWTRGLLIAALLLWLADIAVRRLSIDWRKLALPLSRALSHTTHRNAAATQANSLQLERMERLRKRAGRAADPVRERDRSGEQPQPPAAEPAHNPPYTPAMSNDVVSPPAKSPSPPQTPAAAAKSEPPSADGDATINRLLAAKKRQRR
ncbi:MAG: VWA domain-containing protein [Paenibacillaceae bacterium]|nr:VWA domain-containing protein [Paenibacillaceae bacterium]